jgi:hypothetical protein
MRKADNLKGCNSAFQASNRTIQAALRIARRRFNFTSRLPPFVWFGFHGQSKSVNEFKPSDK